MPYPCPGGLRQPAALSKGIRTCPYEGVRGGRYVGDCCRDADHARTQLSKKLSCMLCCMNVL